MGQIVLTTIPGAAPYQQLQVTLEQRGEGNLVITLTEQHYAPGVGWFDQRSIRLEPRQWQQLQAVLGRKETADTLDAEAAEMPATIAFPGPRTVEPSRVAVGEGM